MGKALGSAGRGDKKPQTAKGAGLGGKNNMPPKMSCKFLYFAKVCDSVPSL